MTAERLRDVVSAFSGKKVLVVGDTVLDQYVFGKVERLNPEAPVPILHALSESTATGGAGNVAKNLVMLSAQASLISVSGSDDTAEVLKEAIRQEGYEGQLVHDDSRPTIAKVRYYVGSQQLLRVDYEDVQDISGNVEEEVIQRISETEGIDAIIVSDYAKGVVTEKVAHALMALMHKLQIPMMVDVKPSRVEFFVGATYMSPNRKEAHEYLGLNQFDNGGKSHAELAKLIRESFQTNVFLTLSADGMYIVSDSEGGTHVPQQHTIEVADTSGCGDSAAATIVLAKLAGASDVEAAELANAAGAVVASKVGAVGLTQQELLDMVTHTHE